VPVLLVRCCWARASAGANHRRPSSGWRPSSATCGRCSSASRAARAWPRPPACCWPEPLLGLATLATWLIIAAFFRYSSLASIVAALFAPFYQLLIWGAGPMALADRGDEPAAGVAP
jgi:hypothetical protein